MPDKPQDLIAGFLPSVAPVTYQRNLIRQVVCELRFPTIYGLVRGKPPLELANSLRKSFPEHRIIDGVNVGPGGVAQDFAFLFKDKKRKNTVTLRSSALNVESTAYNSFEDLLDMVLSAAKAAKSTIDSEFFTRIGLRYINELPYDQGSIGGWVNHDLVMPLIKSSLGAPMEFSGRVASASLSGGFLLQHGISKKENISSSYYTLDFDVWKEDVPFGELAKTLSDLHESESRLFHWSIGPDAVAHMGASKPKNS